MLRRRRCGNDRLQLSGSWPAKVFPSYRHQQKFWCKLENMTMGTAGRTRMMTTMANRPRLTASALVHGEGLCTTSSHQDWFTQALAAGLLSACSAIKQDCLTPQ